MAKKKQYVTILRYGDFIQNMIMCSVTETQRPVKKQKIQKNSILYILLSLIINRKEKNSGQFIKMLDFGGCSEILTFRDKERKKKRIYGLFAMTFLQFNSPREYIGETSLL